MPKVKDKIISQQSSTPLDRVVGQDVQVLERELLTVNNYISLEFLEVGCTEAHLPEEHGRLFLFPIGDQKFNIQVYYLQHLEHPADAAQVIVLHLLPGFFDSYHKDMLMANVPFRFDKSTEQQFTIDSTLQNLLQEIAGVQSITGFLKSLHQSEIAVQLFRRTLEKILVPFDVCQVPACRFLAYDTERDKIADAKNILNTRFDQSISIKELSRMVAMNECYLKKGFKALTGKTIHEYQQELRISKAKELLKTGSTVSAVALQLGFSSISHFSTAFKKATGLKPCELFA